MSEVLVQFDKPVVGSDRLVYRAQACGAAMPDGLWEGWVEFLPVAAGRPVRSPRETTQPNLDDAVYWATGLTHTYLEGALERALRKRVAKAAAGAAKPIFDTPAPDDVRTEGGGGVDPILDPFSVYERGEVALRRKLGALAAMHLINIIEGYNLSDDPVTSLRSLPEEALVDIIVAGVRAQLSAHERA